MYCMQRLQVIIGHLQKMNHLIKMNNNFNFTSRIVTSTGKIVNDLQMTITKGTFNTIKMV